MASVLKNVLRFTGLGIGVPAAQSHLLNINGVAKSPQVVIANAGGFTIAVNSTTVTVTRSADAGAAVDVYTELWHSIEDAQPLPGGISALPFVTQGSGGTTPGDNPVVLTAPNGDVVTLVPGTPVAIPVAQYVRGEADATLAEASIVGLVVVAALPAASTQAQVAGVMSLATTDWDAVTGQVGGLTPNALYFLSTTIGQLTTTPPGVIGQFITAVGRALTSTAMRIDPAAPILL